MTLVLIIIGLLLILFNIRFLNEKKPQPKIKSEDHGNSFRKIYEDEEMDTSAVDIIIGELRVEFSETILELQKEIVALSEKIDQISLDSKERKDSEPVFIDELVEDIPMSKMEQIGLLLKNGHTVDELCEKYQMGRGEISLIEKLYRK